MSPTRAAVPLFERLVATTPSLGAALLRERVRHQIIRRKMIVVLS